MAGPTPSEPERRHARPILSTSGLVRRILLAIFLLSLVGGAGSFFLILRHRALESAASQARLLLATAISVSDYTNEMIFPLLDKLPADRFYEQLVPFHASQAVFRNLRKAYPAYSYRAGAPVAPAPVPYAAITAILVFPAVADSVEPTYSYPSF